MNFIEERIARILEKVHDTIEHPPWIMFQAWRTLLFASWELDPAQLRSLVPEPLEIDTFEGKAFVTIVPMYMVDVHLRDLPPVPFENTFPEINLRTYVRYGGHRGVYFFSIDADALLASLVARFIFHFPYVHAEMVRKVREGWIHLESHRENAELDVRYRGVGEVFQPRAGSVEEFLLHRLSAFYVKDEKVFRGDLQHPQWYLQKAEAEFSKLTIPQAAGLPISGNPSHLLYSAGTDTVAWPFFDVTK